MACDMDVKRWNGGRPSPLPPQLSLTPESHASSSTSHLASPESPPSLSASHPASPESLPSLSSAPHLISRIQQQHIAHDYIDVRDEHLLPPPDDRDADYLPLGKQLLKLAVLCFGREAP